MTIFLFLIVAIVVAGLVAAILVRGARDDAGGKVGFPYLPAKNLFTAAERSFLGVLDQAVGSDHRVFGKVRIADVASVKPGLGNSARQGALNRISGKHFDFVVCRASDLGVVCTVELDDKSHGSNRAQRRDEFVIKVCQTIGLPLLQIPAKSGYELAEIKRQFQLAIGAPAQLQVAGEA